MPKCNSRFSRLIITVKRKRDKAAAPIFLKAEAHMMTRTKPYLTSTDSSIIKCLNIRTCKRRRYLARFKAIALVHICKHKIIRRPLMVPINRLNSSSSLSIADEFSILEFFDDLFFAFLRCILEV